MDTPYEIIEKAFGPVIEIEERVPIWKMAATFGRDFAEISDYIDRQGSSINGMPYARYLDIDWERENRMGAFSQFFRMLTQKWHFQVGMPTASELAGEGALVSRQMLNRRYARTIYRGPYKGVGKTYKELTAWLKAQGLEASGESIEIYLNSPQEVAESELETEIMIPLKG